MRPDPSLDMARAYDLLVAAVAADPRGRAGVAQKLAVSRPLLARVLSPNDDCGLSPKLARAVLTAYAPALCPATGQLARQADCLRAAGPLPTHNPEHVRLWRRCQTCAVRAAGQPLFLD